MRAHVPRLLIAAPSSGAGKTTVACGLLQTLRNRGLRLCAAKCGPDYLDSLFHERVLGTPSCNLDLFLSSEQYVKGLVATHGKDADVLLVEGAMGYYDGIANTCEASSYDVARTTSTPVVLVVDARGRALSLAAEIRGFRDFRTPSQLAGVILNHVSASRFQSLRTVLEDQTCVPVLGYVPQLKEAALPSRHLGLVTPAEISDMQAKLDLLARTLQNTVDIDALLQVAGQATDLAFEPRQPLLPCEDAPTIAVARDEAFCFYYHDTLRTLQELGARLAFFSPLEDARLPADTCGLYLGGGYPELHARQLSNNEALRDQIRQAIAAGLPTIAECGGFLYLHRALQDKSGTSWPMVGTIAGTAARQSRMGHFGYATLTARTNGLLARAGETLAAHEFHYWQSTTPGDAFCARKPHGDATWDCVVGTPTLHAGFPHLHLASAPHAAARFVRACASFGTSELDKIGRSEQR